MIVGVVKHYSKFASCSHLLGALFYKVGSSKYYMLLEEKLKVKQRGKNWATYSLQESRCSKEMLPRRGNGRFQLHHIASGPDNTEDKWLGQHLAGDTFNRFPFNYNEDGGSATFGLINLKYVVYPEEM